jgi:hypothetical protein
LTGGGYGVFRQGRGYMGQVVPNLGGNGSTIYGPRGEYGGQM